MCPLIITPSIARILLTYEKHKLKFMNSSYTELHLHINRISCVKDILKKIISFFKRFIKKVQDSSSNSIYNKAFFSQGSYKIVHL